MQLLSQRLNKIADGFRSLRDSIGRLRLGFQNFLKPIKQLLNNFPVLGSAVNKVIGFFRKFYDIISVPSLQVFGKVITNIAATLSGLGSAIVEVKNQVC